MLHRRGHFYVMLDLQHWGALKTISTYKRTIPNEHIILLNPVVHSFRPMICGPCGLCYLTEPVLDASMMDCMVAWEALGSFP